MELRYAGYIMPSAMPCTRSLWAYLVAAISALAIASAAHAQAPSAPLPAAPVPSAPASTVAKPSTQMFALPPSSPSALTLPPGPPPSAPADDQVCYAAATGIFAPYPKPSPETQAALPDYIRLVMQQIETKWSRNVPRAANDPWVKPKTLYIRFAAAPTARTPRRSSPSLQAVATSTTTPSTASTPSHPSPRPHRASPTPSPSASTSSTT